MDREIFNTEQAAEYIGLSPATLETWRSRGGGPRFCKMGRSVRYRASDLDEFIERGVRENTSAAA